MQLWSEVIIAYCCCPEVDIACWYLPEVIILSCHHPEVDIICCNQLDVIITCYYYSEVVYTYCYYPEVTITCCYLLQAGWHHLLPTGNSLWDEAFYRLILLAFNCCQHLTTLLPNIIRFSSVATTSTVPSLFLLIIGSSILQDLASPWYTWFIIRCLLLTTSCNIPAGYLSCSFYFLSLLLADFDNHILFSTVSC